MKKMNIIILFNWFYMIGKEFYYIVEVYFNGSLVGDGLFIKCCYGWLEQWIGCYKGLFIYLCIVVLEMVVLLLDIQFGDEVIMLFYIFVFMVNVFVL